MKQSEAFNQPLKKKLEFFLLQFTDSLAPSEIVENSIRPIRIWGDWQLRFLDTPALARFESKFC